MGEYEAVKLRRTSAPLPSRSGGLYPLPDEGRYGPPPVYVGGPLPDYFRPREDAGGRKKFNAFANNR